MSLKAMPRSEPLCVNEMVLASCTVARAQRVHKSTIIAYHVDEAANHVACSPAGPTVRVVSTGPLGCSALMGAHSTQARARRLSTCSKQEAVSYRHAMHRTPMKPRHRQHLIERQHTGHKSNRNANRRTAARTAVPEARVHEPELRGQGFSSSNSKSEALNSHAHVPGSTDCWNRTPRCESRSTCDAMIGSARQ